MINGWLNFYFSVYERCLELKMYLNLDGHWYVNCVKRDLSVKERVFNARKGNARKRFMYRVRNLKECFFELVIRRMRNVIG